MPAQQVSHGVITISAPKPELPTADSVAAALPQTAMISASAPPPPVVIHKTVADVQAEAKEIAAAAEQLITDAANASAT
jgi:hypothetical protein